MSDSWQMVDAVGEGWLRIKVPLPFSLKWVNSYLVEGPPGSYTVVDPGLRTEEATALWHSLLEHEGINWKDISRIIVTHQHPDHYGLAGYMQQLSGAPVLMSRRAHAYALRLWGPESCFAEELGRLYADNGMPASLIEAITNNLNSFPARVSPQPAVTYIEPGQYISFGGSDWLLLDAPGHAYGSICFYSQDKRWMLCGDQVLPRITPNISYIPGEEFNPLDDFLANLEQLRHYDVELALPGHRDPFSGFSERIEELRRHHMRRLDQMRELLSQKPLTAFEMCEQLFGSHLRSNPHNLRFAMSETLAHLHYLWQAGRAEYSNGVYK